MNIHTQIHVYTYIYIHTYMRYSEGYSTRTTVGSITRDVVGETSVDVAVSAYEKTVELEKEYELTDKAKKKAKEALDDLQKQIKSKGEGLPAEGEALQRHFALG